MTMSVFLRLSKRCGFLLVFAVASIITVTGSVSAAEIDPGNTVKPCGMLPPKEFEGPQFYIPANDAGWACAKPKQAREIEELKWADVYKIQNPKLVTQALDITRDQYVLIPKLLSGRSDLGLVTFDGFGIKNENTKDIPADIMAYLGKALNINDYFDPTLYNALCVYNGITTQAECARYLKNTLDSSDDREKDEGTIGRFMHEVILASSYAIGYGRAQ